VIFREELSDLKDWFLSRLNLVYVMSREPQDIEILNGRIDRKKADALLEHWVDMSEVDAAFVCGPDGMMQAVAEALRARGYPDAKIRIERFATSVAQRRPFAKGGCSASSLLSREDEKAPTLADPSRQPVHHPVTLR
jgi:ring-1,2-phenylacetyl-CoA epoxidase subunit PaaE